MRADLFFQFLLRTTPVDSSQDVLQLLPPRHTSPFLLGRLEDAADGVRQPFPLRGLRDQLLTTRGRQPVILRAAVVFGCSPFSGDPAAALQPLECWVE